MPATTTSMDEPDLYKLLTWFSPAMPVGAYSYSHGLEWAVEAGLVRTAPDLRAYVETVLRYGSGQLDALFLRASHGAGIDGAFEGRSLAEVTALGAAMRGTRELALESAAQGRALLTTLRQTWPAPLLDAFEAVCRDLAVEPPYACVAGVAAAAHRVPARNALVAHLHAVAANLTSAGIRLVPVGQTDGQRITAALAAAVEEVADGALAGSLDDLGTAMPVVDWCSMRHETQHTRLFRS
jgi:urease accessory protein